MNEIEFEWDNNKNAKNIIKHGISFEEASTVFYDNNAVLFDDPDHSVQENRFLIIGISKNERLLIVSHCYREPDDKIRIISARKANNHEKDIYNEEITGGLL